MGDIMKRRVFVTFEHTHGRLGTILLDTETIDFDDGDSFPLEFILGDPNVKSIQFTSR